MTAFFAWMVLFHPYPVHPILYRPSPPHEQGLPHEFVRPMVR
jgi:hypothetical protein